MNSCPKDIEILAKKIEFLQNKGKEQNYSLQTQTSSKAMQKVYVIITEFLAAIVVGSGIGYALDILLASRPLALIVFLLLGSVAGFLNIFRLLSKEDAQEENGGN